MALWRIILAYSITLILTQQAPAQNHSNQPLPQSRCFKFYNMELQSVKKSVAYTLIPGAYTESVYKQWKAEKQTRQGFYSHANLSNHFQEFEITAFTFLNMGLGEIAYLPFNLLGSPFGVYVRLRASNLKKQVKLFREVYNTEAGNKQLAAFLTALQQRYPREEGIRLLTIDELSAAIRKSDQAWQLCPLRNADANTLLARQGFVPSYELYLASRNHILLSRRQWLNRIYAQLHRDESLAVEPPAQTMTLPFETEECCICLNSLQQKQVATLKCQHTFCQDCLVEALVTFNHKMCPLCRQDIGNL